MICDNCGEEITGDFYIQKVEKILAADPDRSTRLTPMTLCTECLICMNDGLKRRRA